ncbi:MAG: TetR/AcrR family transcriptional regulator [Betaproteobacteria bacterium]|nr:TetR/AcrR family transcriptional regulator [Betaproteobacteria bacterium]
MQVTKTKPPKADGARQTNGERAVDATAQPAAKAALASDAKERLIDAAELLFAELGYASCTFREIAGRSGINQGLLHYYFGSKQNLFTEVFLRRARVVASHRELLLDEAVARHGAGRVPVEPLVRAFITPALSMAQAGPGGAAFVRIHSQLRSEPGDIGLELRRLAFGASTQRYVKALTAACPHLPKKVVYWRFNFMVGSYLVVSSQGGRLEDYSGGSCASSDVESALAQIVPFAVAGFMAPAPARKGG